MSSCIFDSSKCFLHRLFNVRGLDKKIYFDSVREERVLIDGGREEFWSTALLMDALICFYTEHTQASIRRTYNQHTIFKEAVENVITR